VGGPRWIPGRESPAATSRPARTRQTLVALQSRTSNCPTAGHDAGMTTRPSEPSTSTADATPKFMSAKVSGSRSLKSRGLVERAFRPGCAMEFLLCRLGWGRGGRRGSRPRSSQPFDHCAWVTGLRPIGAEAAGNAWPRLMPGPSKTITPLTDSRGCFRPRRSDPPAWRNRSGQRRRCQAPPGCADSG
jgi:hypothetical protein